MIKANNNENNALRCKQCKEPFYEFKFLSLRKYEDVDEEDYDSFLVKAHDFCSEECAKRYTKDRDELKGFTLYGVSRCPGYYECERLDNIRGMCEDEEDLTPRNAGIFSMELPHIISRRCEPAQVGIIKASLALLDLFENFKEESSAINKQLLENTKKTSKVNDQMLENTIQSSKVNEQMLKYTKHLTILTILIAIFTVINILLFVYQLFWGI